MEPRLQLVAVIGTVGMLLLVLELVRRRRLLERYALLWLFSALVLLGLGLWQGLLEKIAATIGIVYAPSALFVIAFGFILVLLLHFSAAVSRLSDQSKVLAQKLALLEERHHQLETRVAETSLVDRDPEPVAARDEVPDDDDRAVASARDRGPSVVALRRLGGRGRARE